MASEHDDDLLDIISDAIDESMDVDWTSRDGARHVLGALQLGGYIRTAAMDALIADSADLIDAPASADALGEVERVARAIAPMICAPVYNGDCDDVSAGQDYARRIAAAAMSAMSPAGDVERAVLAERERCAKACDDAAENAREFTRGTGVVANIERGRVRQAEELAQAIREHKP